MYLKEYHNTAIIVSSHCEYLHECEEGQSNSNGFDGRLDDPFLQWLKRGFWFWLSLDRVQVKSSEVTHYRSFLILQFLRVVREISEYFYDIIVDLLKLRQLDGCGLHALVVRQKVLEQSNHADLYKLALDQTLPHFVEFLKVILQCVQLDEEVFDIELIILVDVLSMKVQLSLPFVHFAVLPVLEDRVEKQVKRVNVVFIHRCCYFGQLLAHLQQGRQGKRYLSALEREVLAGMVDGMIGQLHLNHQILEYLLPILQVLIVNDHERTISQRILRVGMLDDARNCIGCDQFAGLHDDRVDEDHFLAEVEMDGGLGDQLGRDLAAVQGLVGHFVLINIISQPLHTNTLTFPTHIYSKSQLPFFSSLLIVQRRGPLQLIFIMQLSNQQLAQQLRKLKLEQQFKQSQIDNIAATDPQLIEMRKKIEMSYVSKERAKQLADRQVRTLEEKVIDSKKEAEMLARVKAEAQAKERERLALQQRERQNQSVLRSQMMNRRQLQRQARTEYLKEKQIVDQQMQQLIEEQRRRLAKEEEKKKQYFQTMQEQYELKNKIRIEMEQQNKQQLDKIKQYQSKLDMRDRQQKAEMERKEKEKEAIYLKLKEAEEQRRKQLEELQNIRMEYYQFLSEQQHQKKEEEQRAKREQFKRMLQAAQRQQRQMKDKQRQEEVYLQQQFRVRMLERLAEQEKLDQMAREKKRMKEQEHKREVERLWKIKLEQYRQAKEQQQREVEEKRLVELWRMRIVEQEKEKMLREHADKLTGFLHPDLIQKAKIVAGYQDKRPQTGYLQPYKV